MNAVIIFLCVISVAVICDPQNTYCGNSCELNNFVTDAKEVETAYKEAYELELGKETLKWYSKEGGRYTLLMWMELTEQYKSLCTCFATKLYDITDAGNVTYTKEKYTLRHPSLARSGRAIKCAAQGKEFFIVEETARHGEESRTSKTLDSRNVYSEKTDLFAVQLKHGKRVGAKNVIAYDDVTFIGMALDITYSYEPEKKSEPTSAAVTYKEDNKCTEEGSCKFDVFVKNAEKMKKAFEDACELERTKATLKLYSKEWGRYTLLMWMEEKKQRKSLCACFALKLYNITDEGNVTNIDAKYDVQHPSSTKTALAIKCTAQGKEFFIVEETARHCSKSRTSTTRDDRTIHSEKTDLFAVQLKPLRSVGVKNVIYYEDVTLIGMALNITYSYVTEKNLEQTAPEFAPFESGRPRTFPRPSGHVGPTEEDTKLGCLDRLMACFGFHCSPQFYREQDDDI